MTNSILDNFHLHVGDTVVHIKDDKLVGIITHIDDNLIPNYGVTTCNVKWQDCQYTEDEKGDVVWTNKIVLHNPN